MRQALLRGALLGAYTTLPAVEYEHLCALRPDTALRLVRFFDAPDDGADKAPPTTPRTPRNVADWREAIEAQREAIEARREAIRVLDAHVPRLTRAEIGRRVGACKKTVENDLRALAGREAGR